MLFDTHCHLNFPQFKDNWREVAAKCLKEKIWMIAVGCDYQTSKKALEISNFFKEGVFGTVGLHPSEVSNEKFDFEKYFELAKNEKIVAIGEIGFDFWHQFFDFEKQKEVLTKEIELAKKVNKPIIFHCRSSRDKKFDAYQKLLKFLKNYPNLKGVIHSFEGNLEQAEEFLERGFYIGVNGLVTFSKKVAKVIKKLPLEKLILETDSPYLLPIGAEGKINTPCNIYLVALKLAKLKKIDLEEIEKATTSNAKKLFSLG